MDILSKPTATKEQLLAWVISKKPNQLAVDLFDLYWAISVENGVNPIVVYCQSMKETGYMKFGGVLDASFKNTCGLKVQQGGSDYDANAHKRFDSWTKGILAQVEHLCLYAGKEGYPLKDTVDPRHFSYILGKCKTVESLSGNWAGASYGESIVRMCNEVASMKVVDNSMEIDKLNKQLEDMNKKNTSLTNELNNVKSMNSNLTNKIAKIQEIVR